MLLLPSLTALCLCVSLLTDGKNSFLCFFQYPVVAFDEWSSVTNPFTHIQHGQLRVLLAMGLEEQVILCTITLDCISQQIYVTNVYFGGCQSCWRISFLFCLFILGLKY